VGGARGCHPGPESDAPPDLQRGGCGTGRGSLLTHRLALTNIIRRSSDHTWTDGPHITCAFHLFSHLFFDLFFQPRVSASHSLLLLAKTPPPANVRGARITSSSVLLQFKNDVETVYLCFSFPFFFFFFFLLFFFSSPRIYKGRSRNCSSDERNCQFRGKFSIIRS
jgi:hypothetical protein